ncbi:MAG: EF-hand domain-containing protein [archaeon]|nr:EF-hand domain-containing protein [archaeon]
MSRKINKEEEEDPTAYLKDVKYDPKILTRGTYEDIKKAFAFLDKDKSSKLSPGELRTELLKMKDDLEKEGLNIEEVIDMIFDQVDDNGDGEIDLGEFVKILQGEPINDLTIKENCYKVYREFTRGGLLDKDALREIAEQLGDEKVTDEELERMIYFADADGDGLVTGEEFYYILNPTEGALKDRAYRWQKHLKGEDVEDAFEPPEYVEPPKDDDGNYDDDE